MRTKGLQHVNGVGNKSLPSCVLKCDPKQLSLKTVFKRSVLPLLTSNYRRPWHDRDEMGQEDGLSPDFLLLSPNKTEFAEKREGYKGVGTSHCQVASDLLQLAQASLQFSCYVVCRKPKTQTSNDFLFLRMCRTNSPRQLFFGTNECVCRLCFTFWF